MASGLLGCAEGKRVGHWSSVLCLVGSGMATVWYRLEGCVVEGSFVFGGQRYGDSLVPSGGLHNQHALQRGFAAGLRKTTECLGGAGQDANKESITILSH